ncbi:MAG: NAD-dependent epimerase/dehydratase family protein [Ignavibacteria bacterium]|nr:NAD-dependent epimerase/dehydratase family protein [Ignavibacteria bacterium]
MATAFITGATGFIGSHLVDELLKKDYKIKCLIRKNSSKKWLEGKPVEYIEGDLFTQSVLEKALSGVDYVYHVGGVTFAKKKEEFYRGNVEATKSLLDACYRFNPGVKKFVHVSSQAAVGPSFDGKPIDESRDYHPLTTYGRSKVEAEKAVIEYFDKIKCTVVRPPAVYGPRDYAIYEYFKSMNRGLQPLIGFDNKLISLIHGVDLVRGFILAGESDISASEIYFIASEKFYNWRDVGNMTQKLLGRKTVRVVIPHFAVKTTAFFSQVFGVFSSKPIVLNIEKSRELTQAYWICSIEKAQRELGFKESFTLEEGFRDTIDWYKKEGWLK